MNKITDEKKINHIDSSICLNEDSHTGLGFYNKSVFTGSHTAKNSNSNKRSIAYSIQEHYHPGTWSQYAIGEKKYQILAWSCCISTDERALVFFKLKIAYLK